MAMTPIMVIMMGIWTFFNMFMALAVRGETTESTLIRIGLTLRRIVAAATLIRIGMTLRRIVAAATLIRIGLTLRRIVAAATLIRIGLTLRRIVAAATLFMVMAACGIMMATAATIMVSMLVAMLACLMDIADTGSRVFDLRGLDILPQSLSLVQALRQELEDARREQLQLTMALDEHLGVDDAIGTLKSSAGSASGNNNANTAFLKNFTGPQQTSTGPRKLSWGSGRGTSSHHMSLRPQSAHPHLDSQSENEGSFYQPDTFETEEPIRSPSGRAGSAGMLRQTRTDSIVTCSPNAKTSGRTQELGKPHSTDIQLGASLSKPGPFCEAVGQSKASTPSSSAAASIPSGSAAASATLSQASGTDLKKQVLREVLSLVLEESGQKLDHFQLTTYAVAALLKQRTAQLVIDARKSAEAQALASVQVEKTAAAKQISKLGNARSSEKVDTEGVKSEADGRIAALHSEVQKLRSQVEVLQKEKRSADGKVAQLNRDVKFTAESLRASQEKVRALEGMCERNAKVSAKAQAEAQKAKLEAEKRVKEVMSQLQVMEAAAAREAEAIQASRKTVAEKEGSMNMQIQNLLSKIQAGEVQEKDLRMQLEESCSTAAVQRQVLECTQAIAQECQDAAREAMEGAELSIRELQTEVETWKAEYAHAMKSFHADVVAASKDLSALTGTLHSELSAYLLAVETQYDSMLVEVGGMEGLKGALETARTSREASIVLEKKLKETDSTKSQLSAERAQLEAEVRMLTMCQGDMRRELTAAGESMRKGEQERQDLLAQLKDLESKKKLAEQQFVELQNESEAKLKAMEAQSQEDSLRCRDSKNALMMEEGKRLLLESELQDIKRCLSALGDQRMQAVQEAMAEAISVAKAKVKDLMSRYFSPPNRDSLPNNCQQLPLTYSSDGLPSQPSPSLSLNITNQRQNANIPSGAGKPPQAPSYSPIHTPLPTMSKRGDHKAMISTPDSTSFMVPIPDSSSSPLSNLPHGFKTDGNDSHPDCHKVGAAAGASLSWQRQQQQAQDMTMAVGPQQCCLSHEELVGALERYVMRQSQVLVSSSVTNQVSAGGVDLNEDADGMQQRSASTTSSTGYTARAGVAASSVRDPLSEGITNSTEEQEKAAGLLPTRMGLSSASSHLSASNTLSKECGHNPELLSEFEKQLLWLEGSILLLLLDLRQQQRHMKEQQHQILKLQQSSLIHHNSITTTDHNFSPKQRSHASAASQPGYLTSNGRQSVSLHVSSTRGRATSPLSVSQSPISNNSVIRFPSASSSTALLDQDLLPERAMGTNTAFVIDDHAQRSSAVAHSLAAQMVRALAAEKAELQRQVRKLESPVREQPAPFTAYIPLRRSLSSGTSADSADNQGPSTALISTTAPSSSSGFNGRPLVSRVSSALRDSLSAAASLAGSGGLPEMSSRDCQAPVNSGSSSSSNRLKRSSEPSSSIVTQSYLHQHQKALQRLPGNGKQQGGISNNLPDIIHDDSDTHKEEASISSGPVDAVLPAMADGPSPSGAVVMPRRQDHDQQHLLLIDERRCPESEEADASSIVVVGRPSTIPAEESCKKGTAAEEGGSLNRSYGVEEVLAILEGFQGSGPGLGGSTRSSALACEDGLGSKPPWNGHHDRALNALNPKMPSLPTSRGLSSPQDHSKLMRAGSGRVAAPIRDLQQQQQQGLSPLALPLAASLGPIGKSAAGAAAFDIQYMGQGSALVGGKGSRSKALVPYLTSPAAPSGKQRIMSADGGSRRGAHSTS
ncbi:hypothetical protein CEUSTIGMA_g6090.t1 [Chlamydomonas eustigma]|uniref:Uncharacterized protein n=1 Tax=Chlamydomonas eustigma TaxID=1157962 RepID=A0A250X6Y5_9CHLO|nr:hypothetical protein CEUSTIGMA_g6090.t1 [Chlamydomonas eustigma]|eukprot:GAX78652.1 hypothetical protein CEUSTIGMA_g6090.t1 [Chlamydomonas eustigma]